MSLSSEAQMIIEDFEDIFKNKIQGLQNELVRDSPVDTGRFKVDWRVDEFDYRRFRFTMSNNVRYGAVLWAGRKKIGGKWYGSNKGWGRLGGERVVTKWRERLQDGFDSI